MSVQALMVTDTAPVWRRFVAVVPALALGLCLIGVLFRAEIAAAVGVWSVSTAYSHCFFVVPIAAYLLWDRRDSLADVPIRPWPWAALAILPLGVVWLAAERIGIMEGRQLMAISMVMVLVLGVLGPRMWWALSAGLTYLYFLVPFGAFLTPVLQHITAAFIPVGLNFLNIPNYVDEFIIDIPAGRFFVAEACAGLRFLIASVAFGVLYAELIYRSPWRRIAFMAASVVVPVIANGFRALGIVVLGHVLGSAEAAAADHLVYGWVFFSVVIMLLVLAGMPFREDVVREKPGEADPIRPGRLPEPGPTLRQGLAAAVTVAALASIGPAAAAWLDRSVSGAPSLASLRAPQDCQALAPSAPNSVRLRCTIPGLADGVTVTVHSFGPRVNPAVILALQRSETGEEASEDVEISTLAGGDLRGWRVAATTAPRRVTATMLWINGAPAALGVRTRIAQAGYGLTGADLAPLLVAVAAQGGSGTAADPHAITRALAAFLDTHRHFVAALSAQAATPVGQRR